MVRGDETQDKIAPVCRKRLEFGAPFDVGQGPEFVPIAAKHRLVDGPARFGEDFIRAMLILLSRRLEGALPARRLLAFVMQTGGDR